MFFIYYQGVDFLYCFFFQAEDGIRDFHVTGVQTCALPISLAHVWPQFENAPQRAPCTARSRSASSKTSIASLPPSSSATGHNRSPAATAATVCVNGIPNGKFQGETTATTPSGSYRSRPRLCSRYGWVNRIRSAASTLPACSAVQRRCSSARKSSATYDSSSGFPVSAVIVLASSSALSSRKWAARASSALRSA